MDKGITLIEMLLVIGMLALLIPISSPFVSSFVVRNNYQITQDRVVSALRKSQSYAMSGRDTAWGVCQTGGVIRAYQISCASPVTKDDYVIPSGITITGLTDVTFNKLTGTPSSALSISITSAIGSKTISVNGAGMVEGN